MMKKILDLIFPPLCLHCNELCEKNTLFCRGCSGFFELIDPTTRCPYCFSDNESQKPCKNCIQNKRWHIQMAAALDYVGAVIPFIREMKEGKMPHLAKLAVSFMLLQWEKLNWPIPDMIIPIPKRRWHQKEDHAVLIAKALSHALKVPFVSALFRDFDLPQSKKCAKELSFFLKKKVQIHEKTALLVDDVIFSGKTFRKAAEALGEGLPKKLMALGFSRAINYC